MKQIVVVDDDPDIGPAVRDVLESRDVHVEIPGDARTALPAILREPPDLVILDVNMPGMSGWELCAILRRQSTTRAVPILFLTGRHEVKDRITAMQFGGSDYLAKPFSVESLREKVKSLLQPKQRSEAG
ncbi:MAG TPA: response regulator [Thermoanaerobaculia bacterium]|nr:response regulator [Thermoanaerobaculia bacterium]